MVSEEQTPTFTGTSALGFSIEDEDLVGAEDLPSISQPAGIHLDVLASPFE